MMNHYDEPDFNDHLGRFERAVIYNTSNLFEFLNHRESYARSRARDMLSGIFGELMREVSLLLDGYEFDTSNWGEVSFYYDVEWSGSRIIQDLKLCVSLTSENPNDQPNVDLFFCRESTVDRLDMLEAAKIIDKSLS